MRRSALAAALAFAPSPALAHGGDIPLPLPYVAGPPVAEPEATARPGQTLPLKPARTIGIDTDEGTWLSPDPSPDGRWIVFELLGDIYRIPASGGSAKALTRGMAFDSQPVFSPDAKSIAFVSDRSGAENLWIMDAGGRQARQLTLRDDNAVFTSPAWSADGKALFVSGYRAEHNAFELWRFDVATGAGSLLQPVKADGGAETSTLGAAPSADGKSLYLARHSGDNDFAHIPEWQILRRDLASGAEDVLVSAPRSPRPDLVLGTAFRPAVSPDGQWLVYGARDRGQTGLRLLDLKTRADRWLAFPVQHDELQASGWRDLLPRHAFTPDSRGLIANLGGKIVRIDIATGAQTIVPLRVKAQLPLGPSTRVAVSQETGPVRARLIQNPVQSPDGRTLAFSALGSIYTMALDGKARPIRLTEGFQPSWSPDGAALAFVRWTARDAGQVWTVPVCGGEPRQVSTVPAYYTFPAFMPDGRTILAQRSSNSVRMHSYMEYGPLRQADLVALDVAGGAARVVTTGLMGGVPQFTGDASLAYLNFGDGLNAVPLDGSPRRLALQVTGPGWYFAEGRAAADDLRISPDGKWALVQIAQQLHIVELPAPGTTMDLGKPGVRHRKLTDIGADFFAWADGGRTITWALGSTFHRRALAEVDIDPADIAVPRGADVGGEAFQAVAELPRAVPTGALLLRGATVITERGDETIADADLLVRGDRIAAIGPRGSFPVPTGAQVRDVTGKWIVPGFIETHDHIADVRRGVLDFASWGPAANLAYGVTTSFDPSTLSIDMLAYQDAVEAGLMIGSRIPSTGPAIFSFNEFKSYDEVRAVVRRYHDAYRLGNIKMYRSGNRRVRQWVAMAAREVGVYPTTEGALSMKLDMSMVQDGFAGLEHALTAVPLHADMTALMAKSGVGWTATLQITNGGPEGQDWFITQARPAADSKLNRFAPRFIVDMKTRTRTYRELGEYLFPAVAASAAKVLRAGGRIGVGSHGEMPGIGFHWEMQALVMGGMTPAEALRAGTIGSAGAIGREAEFGSIEPGKYADLVVLDRDPLADISNTLAIRSVMLGGTLRDGETLDEQWPMATPFPRRWYCDDRPPGTPDACAPPRKGLTDEGYRACFAAVRCSRNCADRPGACGKACARAANAGRNLPDRAGPACRVPRSHCQL